MFQKTKHLLCRRPTCDRAHNLAKVSATIGACSHLSFLTLCNLPSFTHVSPLLGSLSDRWDLAIHSILSPPQAVIV
jgi:hypothetical protein